MLSSVAPRLSLLFVALALLGSAPSAASNPDFAGTWRMDMERSDPMNQQGLKLENSYRLVLDGENIQTTRTFYRGGQGQSVDWVFVTDGKPHEIPGMREPRKARTKWKKNKLTVSYSMSRQTPRGNFDLDVVENWSLNKKGELEILYSTRIGERNITRKEVYLRQAESP